MSANLYPTSVDALAKAMTFLEERHKIIANNIANAGTPFYKAQSAPMAEFRRALSEAIENHRANPCQPFHLEPTKHIRDGWNGLSVTPIVDGAPDAGILKHDGNNVSLETEMSELAQNTLMHRVMAELLRKKFAGLRSAIAERVDG